VTLSPVLPHREAEVRVSGSFTTKLCLALAEACLGLALLAAQAAATGTIEVSAEAPAITPAPTAGRSVLGSEQIEASGASSLAEALALAPGVSLSAAGGAGAQAAVSIRGSSTNQVLVLVDGLPVSDPSTGLVDLSKLGLAPSDLESIEVVRGGASAQYGPDAVGGVILITTKKGGRGTSRPLLELSLANRSRLPFSSVSGSGFSAMVVPASAASLVDGQEAGLRLSLPGGLVLSAGGERAANAYLYRDSSGVKRTRANADMLSGQALLGWRGALGSGIMDASLGASLRDLGVPGPASSPTPEAREEDSSLRAALAWATDSFFSDRLAFSAKAYGLSSRTVFREDPQAAADDNLASRLGLDPSWSILLGPGMKLDTGLQARYERLDSSNVATASGGAPERLTLGAWVEPKFTSGPWTIAPAARIGWTSDFPSGLSFSLGAARDLGEGLSLSANLSTAYRAPSFDDLWWPAAAGVEGNPGLKPETSWGGDIGARWAKKGVSLQASAYARYVEDVILWQEGADAVWRPSNYGAALYPGLELEAGLEGEGPWSARLSWQYQHSYVLSGGLALGDDLRVPMVPEQSFRLGLGRELGGLRASVDLEYTGLRYYKMANIAYDPAHLVVNAHLRWALEKGGALSLDGLNLLDERYESVQGYPMPGFSLRLGWEGRLGG
jgi:vitamin B12 transporter